MEELILIGILTITCVVLIVLRIIDSINVEKIKKDTIVCRSLYVTKNFEIFSRKEPKDIKEGEMLVEGVLYLHGDMIDIKKLQENYQKLFTIKQRNQEFNEVTTSKNKNKK